MRQNENLDSDSPWRPIEARRSDREVKRQAVLTAATKLFLERGWHRATMGELADRLNITKPALYNYFKSKDDILTECFRIANENSSAALARAEQYNGKGFEKIAKFVSDYIEISMHEYGACMNRIDDRDLRDDVRQEYREIKRSIDKRVRAIVAGGVADGSIEKCDVRLTTFALLGAIQWISHWYKPEGGMCPSEIAVGFSDRLLAGLRPSGRRAASKKRARQPTAE